MSVYVHNFYTDLLLSTRYLLDNIIFNNTNYIKQYQFNYGNRTFQLSKDYNTQFRLPAAIIQLQDNELTLGKKTHIIKQIPIDDINQIPILYNQTKDTSIYLQEEETNINLNININCESQLQAADIKYILNRWIPTNKYIELYEYVAFLEIPLEFLLACDFNVNNDNITNLYTKYDSNLGKIIYCFALRYKPIIKLNSITTNISGSLQRSFQVQCSFTFIIQQPVYLIYHENKIIDAIRIHYGHFNNETIAPINSQLITTANHNTYNIKLDYLIQSLPIYIYKNNTLIEYDYSSNTNINITPINIITKPESNYVKNKTLPEDPASKNLTYLSIHITHDNDLNITNVLTRLTLSFDKQTLDYSKLNNNLNLIFIKDSNQYKNILTDKSITKQYTLDTNINKLLIDFNSPEQFETLFYPIPTDPLIIQFVQF